MPVSIVSIVIPVYNAEARIEQCVESILSQTFKEFEIILVDDGSKDGSLRICQRLAEENHRISVLHQTNAGPGAARNAGMNVASGKYLVFIDADDMILPNHLATLVSAISSDNFDIVWANFIEVDLQGNEVPKCHGFENGILTPTQFCQAFLDGRCGSGSA